MNNIERQRIVLAALLHDIGKFWQRADENSMAKSKFLSQYTKNLEGQYCPLNKDGYYTHKHVLWTAQFFEDFKSNITNLFKNNKSDDSITMLSASHHNPRSPLEKLIQLADWLSSGVDRSEDPDSQKEVEDEKTWESFKKTKMRSIFEFLLHDINKPEYLLPLREQNIEKSQFPTKDISTGKYNELWEKFYNEVKFIQSNVPKVVIETMLYLLHKYTSTIPSSTVHLPDVSLYDHLKSTAAIADCLYEYQYSKGNFDINLKNDDSEYPFLMIGGDISGIQSFIYDIVSKNAAKNLKGRSFYVQLLVQSFIETILDNMGMTSANVIYGSGGGFYILAANTEKNRNELQKLEKNFQEKLFNSFGVSLFVALDSIELNCNDFFEQNISEKWKKLSEKLNKKKRQRYKFLIESSYDLIFTPDKTGGDLKVDAITGEPLIKQGSKPVENDKKINKSTYEQILLGSKLKASDYWIITKEKIDYWKERGFNPANIGIWHYFVSGKELMEKKGKLKSSIDSRKAIIFNNPNFLETAIQGIDNIYGFEYYGGNDYPSKENGEPLSFDELAEKGEGIKRLGVLRMDVDNLGQIFINGMAKEKRTFSRYSTLSRNLDWFFKGYLNTIWNKEEYKNSTQIIYSGGDDLFIIGFWSDLINMAFEIQSEFKKWVCHNPKITLSGGIAIVPGKYPILKGALESAKAEKTAKSYKRQSENELYEKNAFSMFGYALSWKEEFPKVRKWKDDIKLHIKNGMPSSFIGKVIAHYSSVEKFTPDLYPLRVLWMTAYDFERMKTRIKNEDTKYFIENCKRGIYQNRFDGFDCKTQSNYHFLELLYLACRWADFELRD